MTSRRQAALSVLAAVPALLLVIGCGSAASRPAPRLFASSSFWNKPLPAHARLDPRSRSLSSLLLREVRHAEAEKGGGPDVTDSGSSTPLYVVSRAQATVRVIVDGTSDRALQRALNAVPLPAHARPAPGSDAQLTVWQPSTDKLWEFWRLSRRRDGWHTETAGAIKDVSKSPGYYTTSSWPGANPASWGTTATRLPKIGGTILRSELARGHIDHAVAVDLPHPRAVQFSWPAQATDGKGGPADIPEGARFRLDPRLDVASLHLPPLARMVAEAAQRYGLVVRDQTGNDILFFVEDGSRFGRSRLFLANGDPRDGGPLRGRVPRDLFSPSAFPWSHMQLLKMHLCTRAPCAPPS